MIIRNIWILACLCYWFSTDPLAAQSVQHPLILEVNKGDNLGEIIEKLSSRHRYQFAYAPALSALQTDLSGKVQAPEVADLLQQLFPDLLEIQTINEHQVLLRSRDIVATDDHLPDTELYLQGTVVDVHTDEPLADVLIYHPSGRHCQTGADGRWQWHLPNALREDTIILQYLGYHEIRMPIPALARKDTLLMHPDPVMVHLIVVTEPLPSIRNVTSGFVIDMHKAQSASQFLPGVVTGDVIRMAQMLPGIQANDDLSTAIAIRGSEGDETLMLLDGIPIYKSDHFYGIFSNINGHYIGNAQLYKNGIPSQYSSRTGGMFSMTAREAGSSMSGHLESNLLYSTLALQIPFANEWQLSLAGRRSYLNAADFQTFDYIEAETQLFQTLRENLTRDQILSSEPDFNFYDVNAQLAYRPGDKTKIDLNLFASQDDFTNNYDLSFLSRRNNNEVVNREVFRSNEVWNNLGLSLKAQQSIAAGWNLQTHLWFSRHDNSGSIQSMLQQQRPDQPTNDGFTNAQINQIQDAGGDVLAQWIHSSHALKTGLSYQWLSSSYDLSTDERSILMGDEQAGILASFAEYQYTQGPWQMIMGIRASHYQPTTTWYLDPRIQINYQLNDHWKIKGSWHRNHQFVRELSYESRLTQVTEYFVLADQRYPVGASSNTMLGFTFLESRWMLDVEGYLRQLEGVMEYSLASPGFFTGTAPSRDPNYRLFVGEGNVKGLDVALRYQGESYQSLLSYTLSERTRQYPGVRRNQPFPAQDDRRHQLQWTNSYELGRLTLSGTLVYSSGKPYLDLPSIQDLRDRNVFTNRQFLSRLPSYQRFDLGVDYRFPLWKQQASIGVSCFNLFDHANVKYLQYIFAVPSDRLLRTTSDVVGTETSLLGRTFNVTFRLAF